MNNFGELLPSSLAGSVFIDSNDDGVREAAEKGIAKVTVTLTGTDDLGSLVDLTTTSAVDGSYLFSGLRPGTYTVSETQPPTYNDGKDAVGSSGGQLGNDTITEISLVPGTNAHSYTFGERGVTLSGMVFLDQGTMGTLEPGDSGMSGVTITLLDDAGNAVATTTTNPDGTYQFQDLPIGAYSIVESKPDPFGNSTPMLLSVSVPGSGLAAENFGLDTGSLAGSVYVDSNNDGQRSASETGIAGVIVTLTGTTINGNAIALATTTAADGSYRFSGLLVGTYTLAETQPSAYLDGKDRAGVLGGTMTNDRVANIQLEPAAVGADNEFGELTPASLAGFAYLDLHRDHSFDAGDVGIAHVVVTLTGMDDLGNGQSISTTTADDGSYLFTNLRPGTYAIAETQPAAFRDSADQIGTQGGRAGNDLLTNVVLNAGIQGTANNFGEITKPGCKLSVFVPYGINSVAYLNWRRAQDPARFDHYHPALGPFLAKGGNPAHHVRVPQGPAIRHWTPTLGQNRATSSVAAQRVQSAHVMNRRGPATTK
jgi:hypothetical protein